MLELMPGEAPFPQAFPQLAAKLSNPSLIATFFAPINAAVDEALSALGTSVAAVTSDPTKFSYLEQVIHLPTSARQARACMSFQCFSSKLWPAVRLRPLGKVVVSIHE
jgi:hypothetical protein